MILKLKNHQKIKRRKVKAGSTPSPYKTYCLFSVQFSRDSGCPSKMYSGSYVPVDFLRLLLDV